MDQDRGFNLTTSAQIIHNTFKPYYQPGQHQAPANLIPSLIHRFHSKEGKLPINTPSLHPYINNTELTPNPRLHPLPRRPPPPQTTKRTQPPKPTNPTTRRNRHNHKLRQPHSRHPNLHGRPRQPPALRRQAIPLLGHPD